jgi:hypothetical protein
MSDTNRVAIRATKEGTFGVVPTTPDLYQLAIAGAPNLAFAPETVVSELLRDDRQIDDLALVGGEASGDINSELAFRVHDLLLEGAFFNPFQERVHRTNDAAATQITAATATAFTVTDEGDTVTVNDILRGEGFNVAGNNAYHIVDGVPTNTSFTTVTAEVEATPPSGAQLHVVGHRATASDIAATATPDTLTSSTLDFTTLGLEAGDWIKLDGFSTDTDNNDYVRCLSIAANLITLDVVPTGWGADSGSGDTVDIYLGERLKNGTTFYSYTLEETFSDHSPVTYQYFRGMVVDGLSLTAASQSIVTLTTTFSGKDAVLSDSNNPTTEFSVTSGRVTGAVDVDYGSLQVLNSSSNVGRIARGGTAITGSNFVLEATVEIANNLRQLPAVGFIGAVDIGVGEFGVTGNLNTYFDDATLAQSVLDNTETSYDMRFEDASEHAILIDAPRIKFSEGAPEVPGKNQDVTINLAYQAIRYATFGYTLKWMRFQGVQ